MLRHGRNERQGGCFDNHSCIANIQSDPTTGHSVLGNRRTTDPVRYHCDCAILLVLLPATKSRESTGKTTDSARRSASYTFRLFLGCTCSLTDLIRRPAHARRDRVLQTTASSLEFRRRALNTAGAALKLNLTSARALLTRWSTIEFGR
jgi:hypothetical protein